MIAIGSALLLAPFRPETTSVDRPDFELPGRLSVEDAKDRRPVASALER